VKPLTLLYLLVFTNTCFGQELLSSFKPKTKKDKEVIAKLKSLPEIKDLYARPPGKNFRFDIMFNSPDSGNPKYRFQVGTDHKDRFSTNYYLSIDPKTLQVYYEDFDDEGVQDITLQQWRYWRNKPEFNKPHKWVKGKMIVVNYKKHVQKKSSQSR